jgi:type VI secretion system secreted protein Hcp
MSLPAYLFLYDENGMLIQGNCMIPGREGAIEIMNSSYGEATVDSHTGNMTGTRQHGPVTLHKQVDKVSPILQLPFARVNVCKAIIKYYEIVEEGLETEVYNITLDSGGLVCGFYSCLLSGQFCTQYA